MREISNAHNQFEDLVREREIEQAAEQSEKTVEYESTLNPFLFAALQHVGGLPCDHVDFVSGSSRRMCPDQFDSLHNQP